MWPADQEKQWQIMVSELTDAEHGLYLATYDRPWTRDALWRRLQAEATQRQWGARHISLGAERLAPQIMTALAEIPLRLVTVRLDTVQQARWRALNLEREALHDLPVNILFTIAQETYPNFLNAAHDLVTWIAPPYSFVLPEFGIPDLPPPSPCVKLSLRDQIDYYRDQIRQTVERNQREDAFRLLPSLADLYTQAEMYGAAQKLYQALAVYYDQAADERQARQFVRQRDIAEGWRILADLDGSAVLSHTDREILQRLFDARSLSVAKMGQGFVLKDETGRTRTLSLKLVSLLSVIFESVSIDTAKISREHLTRLRENLERFFSVEELRTLCFDLGVDFESIGGEGKGGKTRELVAHFLRRGNLPELIAAARRARPAVRWDESLTLVEPSILGDGVYVGGNIVGNMTPFLDAQTDDGRGTLDSARKSLALLEQEAAAYTSVTIPIRLRLEIEDKRRELAELKARS